MIKQGITRGNGVSLLLALLLLLFTASIVGCGNQNDPPIVVRSFSADSQAAFKDAVDNALADATNKRGISVAVHKGGYTTWTYAAGYADGNFGSATGTAMTTATPFYAYSITKTMVSALVLTQINYGLYSLDDTVADLLANNVDYNSLSAPQKALLNTEATVRQLLTHTSGMPDYAYNPDGLIPMCNPENSWKPADILEKIVFEPFIPANIGVYQYSSTNYILLGMIAQEKSPGHQPLNTLLASTFFRRLGINAKLAPQDAYPSGIAHPYDNAALFGLPLGSFLDFSVAITWINPAYNIYTGIGRSTWAAGGIIATAADIAKWGYALYDPYGLAITPAVRDILKNSALSDNAYGYGVNYNDFTYADGTSGGTYGHNGTALGYRTLLQYEKSKGITVVILANVNDLATNTGYVNRELLAEALFNAYKE